MSARDYTIGRLARAVGVHVETVRYYERRGLLPRPPRPSGGIRRYGAEHLERLAFIRRAQQMGFNLREIHELLQQRMRASCETTRALISSKLEAIDRRLRELGKLRDELARWAEECELNTRAAPCPALAHLTNERRDGEASGAAA